MSTTTTRVVSTQQKRHGNSSVMSASVPNEIYEFAVRAAELNGYETMSHFIRDAIIDKVQSAVCAMSAVCSDAKIKKFDAVNGF